MMHLSGKTSNRRGGLVWLYILLFTLASQVDAQTRQIKVGILTDCQYCNCSSEGNRIYKGSLRKLDSCIRQLNSLSLDAIFHLGDMIDHDYGSYDSVLPRFQQFRPPLHLVLGNHDYMIKKRYKPGLTGRLGMTKDHYVVDLANWRFIILNGDDLSYSAPQDKDKKQERNDMVSDQYGQLRFNGMPWNGGIGKEQMKWLESLLDESENTHRNVIVLCHFPLFTKENHNLFNNREVFQLIARYLCVKAYFNGHYHSGNYKAREGIHLVNFKGMVDSQENAFSVVTLTFDSILIKGYGREPDRRLKIRNKTGKQ